ncbi:MAG: hypothetical protein ACK5VT_00405 [Alphaproteobacteria bacterium]
MDPRLKILMDLYPDYQSFTAADFRRLSDAAMNSITGAFAHKVAPEALIPQSFVRQYGDDAAGEMMLAVQRELLRRGKTETYATATLNGGIGNAARAINPNTPVITSDVPASVTLTDNTVRHSTAPRILNYQIAQDALALMARNEAARKQGTYTPQTSFEVTIPQSISAAVADANKGLPASIRTTGFSFLVEDEAAFMSGYATRAGASRDIGPVTMQYPASAVCPAQKITSRIFNPSASDEDAALAWAAGYIQSDVDQMPAPQRNAAVAACPPRRAASR